MHNCIADEGVVESWDGVVEVQEDVEIELFEDKLVGADVGDKLVWIVVWILDVWGELVGVEDVEESDVGNELVGLEDDEDGLDVEDECVVAVFSVSITVAPGLNVINWSANIIFLKKLFKLNKLGL